ncbi:DDB1- and CUL4-associated factor 17 isoform X1 [Nerophis ophidion]|uniref:DDB1- and CUL4-associated factor 17 isoform X1 n=1 Tax=Nerophis ophidion TaxID=159077 RepID=UPI002AE06E84|nr:DDB1- and CUL4-associated factor 17 isoform X1 [Nerophis ophidion]XP_061736030.1 DDB1- and CUL4-associated factor 17 isoform X1 [Nerophis ophidion]
MMAPHWKTSNINAAEALSRRSRGISGSLTRLNLKVLRDILVQGNRDFSEVCSKTSNSQIMYENGKIYLDSYVRCYTCVHSEPHLLYNLPKRCETAKFQDALLLQCPLENTLASPSDQKSSLLVLNDNNWLYRLSDATGQELERVFLSSKHRFKYLSWDVSQEIFYVKSVQIKDNTWPRQADIRQSIVAQLAIFQIFPLQIVGVMEVNKQVFGSGVTDVVLSQGLLVVSYSRAVKFFSFEHIVKKYMKERLALGMASTLLKGKKVGEFPFGIPVNIQITEQPPVLFEVPCSNTGLQIGGFPWHYIHTPPQKRHHGTHHICSLRDRTMATNGIQNMNCCSLESDVIFFHPDDSGRIIHKGPSTINILKILGELSSKVVEDFSMATRRHNIPTSQVTVTSSGRAVKRRIQQLDDDPDLETFHMVEYEDELDLLAVVVTNGADGEGRARIQLHDNQSGRVLKTVDLSETWDETFRHDLVFDKDTIIHIEQKHTKVCCHVYKLQAADI